MKIKSNNNSSYLTEKQFRFIYDYYTYQTLSGIIHIKSKDNISEIKENLKNNFNKILPTGLTNNNAIFHFTVANVFMNLFNFTEVVITKSYHSNELIKTIFFKILNVDTRFLSFEPKEFYSHIIKTFKSLILLDFNPKIFFSKSSVFGLSYFSFLYKFRFVGELKTKDWIELFFLGGISTIPFNIYLENLFFRKYVLTDVSSNTNFSLKYIGTNRNLLISLKSVLENFLMMSGYFLTFTYFSGSEEKVLNKTLNKLENYEIFKETIESNETFLRMKNIYIKDEFITEVDYMLPILYTTALMTILYTPIDFVMRLLISMERDNSFSLMFKKLTKSSPSAQDKNFNEFILNSLRNNLRINFYRFFVQYGIITYYFFHNF